MCRTRAIFRLTATVAYMALLSDGGLPVRLAAQPAPPPLPEPYQSQPSQSQADPPARVGRVARLAGTVSFRTESDDQWAPASVNYPVSNGDAFWTEPAASAELEIADSRITLAEISEFDIATLDSSGLQAVAAQGEAYIHLRALDPGETWSVQTPRGLVHLNAPGRYNISVGSTQQPTRVTVVDGSAQIDGPNVSLQVGSGQTATIDGTTSFEGNVGPIVRDPFLIARLDAERPAPVAPAPLPPQVVAMPGGNDLRGVGTWSEAPDYGQVWYPPVASGWVPYREGHWAFVAPWGWTWVDDAPWGFAPFHYGRWVEFGGRWCWSPGHAVETGHPVYAPALVAFVGLGAGVAVGAHSVGWVPLGPREPFHPWYHTSDRYLRAMNVNHVTNFNNNVTVNTFVNQSAATVIPGSDMARSRAVQAVARPLTEREFAGARPIVGQQPVLPTVESAGVTPAAARAFNLPLSSIFPTSPGPVVHPSASGFGAGPGRPALATPRPIAQGNPNIRVVGGSPPFQPNRPPIPTVVTPTTPPVTAPQTGQRPPVPQGTVQRTGPNGPVQGGMGPGFPRQSAGFVPGSVVHADPRPLPQVVTPVRPETQPVAPAPHPEAQRFVPPAAPPPRMATPAQMPRFEPPHVMPRQEPQRTAVPAPRPEQPHPADIPPAFRPNRSGDQR
jgi:hypothetical protein